MGTSTKYRPYITDRKEFFNLIRKKYPNDYHQMISDRLYTSYTNDMFPINSGLIPKSGNASTTPKTVGQIAQQLLDSWEPVKQASSIREISPKSQPLAEQPLGYFDELRIIADKMEVFPIDLIARQGSFSNIGYGRPTIGIRLELTNRNFRYFYDFCELALRATEEDIEVCVDKIKSASPKEQSLILTVIYVYSFPWSKEPPFVYSGNQEALKKYWEIRNSGGEDLAFNVLLGYRSWLGMNYHNFDTQNRPICEEVIRSKYKNIVEKFINDPQVAFPAITFSPQEEIENRNYEHYERYKKITENIDDKLKRIRGELSYRGLINISLRKEKLDLLKENYPEEYQQIISDIFFLLYIGDSSPSYPSGIGPKKGNTSATPKTVGQIAQQLIDSWEPMKQTSLQEKKIKDSPTRPPLPSLPPLEFKIVP